MGAVSSLTVLLTAKDNASKHIGGLNVKMRDLRKTAKIVGTAMLGTSVAIGGASLKMAADFDQSMREVNTMLQLPQKEYEAMSKQVKNLSSDVGVSAGEMSKGLYQIVSAGVPAADALDLLDVAAKAAIGGVTSTEVAVDGITTVLNAFKLETGDAGQVADVMFTTVKSGKTTFEELSNSLYNVAPLAATAGISFEEVSAAIATLTKQGVPTRTATNQIKMAIQSMLKPTEEMAQAIEATVTPMVASGEVSGELVSKYSKLMSEVDSTRSEMSGLESEITAGNQAYTEAESELEELTGKLEETEEAFSDAKDAVSDLEDQLAEARREMDKLTKPNLTGMEEFEDEMFRLDHEANKLEISMIEAKKAMDLRDTAGLSGEALEAAQKHNEAERAKVDAIKANIDALKDEQDLLQLRADVTYEPQIRELEEMAEKFKGLDEESTFEDIKTQMLELGGQTIPKLKASHKVLTDEVKKASKEYDQTEANIATVKDTMSDLKTELEENNEQYQAAEDHLSSFTGELETTASGLATAMIETKGFQGTLEALSGQADGNSATLGKMYGSVEGLQGVLGLTGENAQTFTNDLTTMQKAVEDGTASTDAYNEMNEATNRQWGKLVIRLKNVGITLGTTLMPVLERIVEKITPIIISIADWIDQNKTLSAVILTAVGAGGALSLLVGFGPKIVSAAKLVKLALTIATGHPILLGIGLIIAAGVLLWQNWDTVKEKAKEIWETIAGFFTKVWDGIVTTFKDNWENILTTIFPAVGIISLFTKHWEPIKGFFTTMWNTVWTNTSTVFNNIKDAMISPIKTAINYIIDGVNWLVNQLNKIQISVPSWVPEVGGKGYGVNIPKVSKWMAEGGIVNRPTIIGAGEAGPEAIVPLSRAGEFGMGGGPVHIHVHIGDEEFEEFIVEKLSGTLRLQGA